MALLGECKQLGIRRGAREEIGQAIGQRKVIQCPGGFAQKQKMRRTQHRRGRRAQGSLKGLTFFAFSREEVHVRHYLMRRYRPTKRGIGQTSERLFGVGLFIGGFDFKLWLVPRPIAVVRIARRNLFAIQPCHQQLVARRGKFLVQRSLQFHGVNAEAGCLHGAQWNLFLTPATKIRINDAVRLHTDHVLCADLHGQFHCVNLVRATGWKRKISDYRLRCATRKSH